MNEMKQKQQNIDILYAVAIWLIEYYRKLWWDQSVADETLYFLHTNNSERIQLNQI